MKMAVMVAGKGSSLKSTKVGCFFSFFSFFLSLPISPTFCYPGFTVVSHTSCFSVDMGAVDDEEDDPLPSDTKKKKKKKKTKNAGHYIMSYLLACDIFSYAIYFHIYVHACQPTQIILLSLLATHLS
jgi:hypothetical protein